MKPIVIIDLTALPWRELCYLHVEGFDVTSETKRRDRVHDFRGTLEQGDLYPGEGRQPRAWPS